MSRRASLFARENPGGRRVRFPDEVVFDEDVRDNDCDAVLAMLRRASVDIDVNRINSAGLTALHQAALDGNLSVIKILLRFGADINCRDADTWTPLHAACAMNHQLVISFLLDNGSDTQALNCDNQRPVDLVDAGDMKTVALMLSATVRVQDAAHTACRQSVDLGSDSGHSREDEDDEQRADAAGEVVDTTFSDSDKGSTSDCDVNSGSAEP